MGASLLEFVWPWMAALLPLPWLFNRFLPTKNENDTSATIMFPRLQYLSAVYTKKNKFSHSLTWKLLVYYLAWCCLIVSLMRPELVKDLVYSNNSGYDLMLAVDISPSMDTVDFKANGRYMSRIAATKKVVANFVQQRGGDRVGLIVFAKQAFLTIPLTLDNTTVVKMLNNLMIGMAGESTAIGDAIGIGVQNLRKRPQSSRVLILLTDGVDIASSIPPLEATKIAVQDKIKIYTIGVGSNLDDNLLEQIAQMTGGVYAKADSMQALEQVYAHIDSLEKSEAIQNALLIKTPLYQYCVYLALFCLLIIFITNLCTTGKQHEFT